MNVREKSGFFERDISIKTLPDLATEVLLMAGEESAEGAVVLGLSGDLGAGKTTFTQTLARILGVQEVVTSPTFVIQKQYVTEHPTFSLLVHIDAYRIEDPEELVVLGFKELLKRDRTLVVIEWAERVQPLIPIMLYLHFSHGADEGARKVTGGRETYGNT